MALSFSRPDPSSPAAVSEANFSTGRRGFDQQEVRDFLRMVAAELARLQERERFLERELRDLQRRSPTTGAVIDDDTATRLLGEEAARILHTAREGGNAIRAKAEESAAQLLREAADDAQRQREEADLEASRRRTDVAADAEAELAMAKQQGREMVEEARAYRERVLSELAKRRDLARQQIEHLIHGRERLLQAFERARLVAADVLAEMTPIEEPEEFVDLSPTTGPVPIMVPANRLGDVSSIDDDALRPPPDEVEVVALRVVDPIDDENGVDADDEVVDNGEPEADDDTDTDIAHLFASLRAARVEPAEPEPSEAGDVELTEDTPFRQRDATLVPLIVAGARKLKRVLADEQNDVLDALRRGQPGRAVDELLPEADEQATRYVGAIALELDAAAAAGAASMSTGSEEASEHALGRRDAHDALLSELVEPLRQRLDHSVGEGGGDHDAVGRRVRAVYREWKTQRIDEQLDDVFRLAYASGAVAAVAPGTPVRWLVDPDGPPSPDCEDNALAGATPLGEAFPSGHQWPPMHAGCRCLLILTDG